MEVRDATTGVMSVLKQATQPLHDSVERHPFQGALFRGQLPVSDYVSYLEQMFCMYQALESHLRELMQSHPAFSAIVKEHQFHTKDALADLQHFGSNPGQIEPLPATQAIINQFREFQIQQKPWRLLGAHYVLEGSTNGGKHLSRIAQKIFNLSEGQGTQFLNPYGELQGQRWGEFKTAMETVLWSEAEIQELAQGAKIMFEAIGKIFDDLFQARSVGAAK